MTSTTLEKWTSDARGSSRPPLRVLIAAWAPFRAGAEVAAERLAVGLQASGHHVTVVVGTQGETLLKMREAGIDARFVPLVHTDKWNWLKYRSGQRQLRQILREVLPDVVHANDLPTSQTVGQATRRLGVPLICHHRWIFGPSAIDWLNKFGADRHLFVSNWLRKTLCENSTKLRTSPCDVVYDGLPLPPTLATGERSTARRELELSDDRAIVLFAGQMIVRKGVADLLHAWLRLPEVTRANADLILIGDDLENDGRYRLEMEHLARKLDVRASFRGHQSNVSRWIVASDVCVVPSHEEPLGNATLEAMAHGRPVVATRVGGIPEMVVDGETGVLVPPKDPVQLAAALTRLLGDVELRRDLGRSGRRRCEEMFSQAAHVDAVVRQYRQVIEDRARVSA